MQNNSFLHNISKGAGMALSKITRNPYRRVNLGWLKTKYYKHLPGGVQRKHVLFGKNFNFLSPQELLHGLKEIFLENIYNQQLPENAYVIDCGANIGLSVIFIKQICPTAEILAFEPDEKNFELLTKNIDSFGYNKVTARKEAVWTSQIELSFSSEGNMSSHIAESGTDTTIKVQAIRLKDYLNRPIDFLKIDIEGAEFEVLKDIAENLHHVKKLFIEYHGNYNQNHELLEMLNILNKNGFYFYIKEATPVYTSPFLQQKPPQAPYDIQLNIFCVREVHIDNSHTKS